MLRFERLVFHSGAVYVRLRGYFTAKQLPDTNKYPGIPSANLLDEKIFRKTDSKGNLPSKMTLLENYGKATPDGKRLSALSFSETPGDYRVMPILTVHSSQDPLFRGQVRTVTREERGSRLDVRNYTAAIIPPRNASLS